ncbi:hypothetical protein J669_2248 [Acinetobacter baumannii 1295549]|nr:hypothetical protein J669_2248 [Acinetobacter baumannii 1295549]EXR92586.1 hypothetical protein J680_0766 [Acinetobacter baumannii 277047]EXS38270.1 hypothetical protein J677_1766 [Acinetobacter baumannii 426863]
MFEPIKKYMLILNIFYLNAFMRTNSEIKTTKYVALRLNNIKE